MARSKRIETPSRRAGRMAAAWKAVRRRTKDGKLDEPDIVLDTTADSVAAAMGAAVAHILDRPDSIRHRAQTAATIVSAVVAALLVAAIAALSRVQTESWNVRTQVLVVLATVMWICTVVLFVRVVVFAQRKGSGRPYPGFVTEYQRYAQMLRRRLRLAALSSTFALVFAVAAVGAELYELQRSEPRLRLLVMSPKATAAVSRLCGHPLPADEVRRGEWTILGRVGTSVLSRPLVPVEVTAIAAQVATTRLSCTHGVARLTTGDCDGIVVRLPKGAIVASSEVHKSQQPRC